MAWQMGWLAHGACIVSHAETSLRRQCRIATARAYHRL